MYFSFAGNRIMHVGLRTNCSAVQLLPCHPHFNSPWDVVPPTEEMQDKTCKRRDEMSFSVMGQLQPATSDECGSRSHQLSVNFSGWRVFFECLCTHALCMCLSGEVFSPSPVTCFRSSSDEYHEWQAASCVPTVHSVLLRGAGSISAGRVHSYNLILLCICIYY